MSQHYSDPKRATNPTALPDLEVFYLSHDEARQHAHCGDEAREDGDPENLAGWYWHACFPGCLPDGEPSGPFKTEAEALADAREGYEDEDEDEDEDEGLNVVRPSELTDEDRIVAIVLVRSYGTCYSLTFCDDGFGPLWAYVESLGIVGVVRARTWDDAYNCALDEIMYDADENDPENQPDKDGNLPEGLHYRGNGVPSNPDRKSAIAQEDLNGSALRQLADRDDDGTEYFAIVER